jgi:Fe-S cluster assembly protein SufD
LTRNEITVRLEGAGAECHLNGAYLMRGRQHCDNTTTIEHLVPETSCREVFKGVLDDEARAVFQGRIVVHPGAQKSNGHQLSKALLLSDRAEIDTKPELEIYADDVLCSHGATAGALDDEALFYLRSRGIPEAKARRMLIEAFLAEAINSIAAEGLCPALMSGVVAWLTTAGEE